MKIRMINKQGEKIGVVNVAKKAVSEMKIKMVSKQGTEMGILNIRK